MQANTVCFHQIRTRRTHSFGAFAVAAAAVAPMNLFTLSARHRHSHLSTRGDSKCVRFVVWTVSLIAITLNPTGPSLSLSLRPRPSFLQLLTRCKTFLSSLLALCLTRFVARLLVFRGRARTRSRFDVHCSITKIFSMSIHRCARAFFHFSLFVQFRLTEHHHLGATKCIPHPKCYAFRPPVARFAVAYFRLRDISFRNSIKVIRCRSTACRVHIAYLP